MNARNKKLLKIFIGLSFQDKVIFLKKNKIEYKNGIWRDVARKEPKRESGVDRALEYLFEICPLGEMKF